ncbi:MAG: large subunit ribosomal protein L13 [Patiriisocius sp.]
MDTQSYKTLSGKKETADKKWLVLDAEGKKLGRLASEAAKLLRGKHKTNFTPHADCGDYVIVINAEKIELSGAKWTDKKYIRFTGYPGGQRIISANQLMAKKPFAMVEKAIKGMLPSNTLGAAIYRNLHVVVGPVHKHEAQKPKEHKF